MGNTTTTKRENDLDKGHVINDNIFKYFIDGKKKKSEMCGQDALDIITSKELGTGLSFFGVYDGHGIKGKDASTSLQMEIRLKLIEDKETIRKFKTKVEVEKYFTILFERINSLFEKRPNDFLSSGSCAICILIIDTKLYSINLGDSRAVLGIKKSEKRIAYELSVDHKPLRDIEYKRIIEQNGEVLEKVGNPPRIVKKNDENPGLAVSRTIGDILGHECGVCSVPEVIEKDMDQDDCFVVIGSDGIWDLMNSSEVIGFVFNALEVASTKKEKIVEELVKECRNRWELLNLLKQKYYSELMLVKERSNAGNKKKNFSQNTFDIDDISGIIFFINFKFED